jgi:hypothetical protein
MKLRKNLMLAAATTNETAKPTAKTPSWLFEKEGALLTKSKTLAASIVGTASIKENSTMVFLFNPASKPPTMVAAERDTPGIIATA